MDPVLLNQLVVVSKGNPGALSVLMELFKTQPRDKLNQLLEQLEKSNTCGPDIYILWKDQCKKDTPMFIETVLALE